MARPGVRIDPDKQFGLSHTENGDR